MSKFKVGDEVRLTADQSAGDRGDIFTIEDIDSTGYIWKHYKKHEGAWPAAVELVNRPADLYPGEVACVDEKTGRVEYVKPSTGGTKHDHGKPDLSLLPLPGIEAAVRALGYGAGKYGRDNFRKGFASDRLVSACLRHVHAWNNGEDNDPESGVNHLGHAVATLLMLLTNIEEGTCTDTRYKK